MTFWSTNDSNISLIPFNFIFLSDIVLKVKMILRLLQLENQYFRVLFVHFVGVLISCAVVVFTLLNVEPLKFVLTHEMKFISELSKLQFFISHISRLTSWNVEYFMFACENKHAINVIYCNLALQKDLFLKSKQQVFLFWNCYYICNVKKSCFLLTDNTIVMILEIHSDVNGCFHRI